MEALLEYLHGESLPSVNIRLASSTTNNVKMTVAMAAAGAWAAGAGQNKSDDGKAHMLIIPSSP